MRKLFVGITCFFFAGTVCFAQSGDPSPAEDPAAEEGSGSFIPGASIAAPEFNAQITGGFNYDFLKDPTRVSFEYPKGYIGLNIPLKYGLDKGTTESITGDLADQFENGDEFEPTASAQQNANTTVRVEVPMMRGVGMFSNIQNFYLGYKNTLGAPSIKMAPGLDSIDLFLEGMIAVPLDVAMGWETMTFGYAYKLNDNFKFAINLHRHIFKFDLSAKIDIDLLGYFGFNLPPSATSAVEDAGEELGGAVETATEDLLSAIQRQNFGYVLQGQATGHYDVEAWSPTFAAHIWRVGCVARIGINTRAPGYLSAKYIIPFFVNPETFMVENLADPAFLMENYDRFLNSETDSIEYRTDSDLIWKMPHGFTFTFDIVREKLWLSYTKFVGEIQMDLENIITIRVPQGNDTSGTITETVNFDVGVQVDHIILLHGVFRNAFMNLGVFSMDFRYGDQENLLESVYPVPFGGGALLPVLNLGTTFGAKLKLLLELDVLPLSALKTGIIYYF